MSELSVSPDHHFRLIADRASQGVRAWLRADLTLYIHSVLPAG